MSLSWNHPFVGHVRNTRAICEQLHDIKDLRTTTAQTLDPDRIAPLFFTNLVYFHDRTLNNL